MGHPRNAGPRAGVAGTGLDRHVCAWMSVRSSVRSCQLCTAQKAPTAVRNVTWRAPKNMRLSFPRRVMTAPPTPGVSWARLQGEANEGEALEQGEEEQRAEKPDGRERSL